MRLDHEQGKRTQWTERSISASAERGGPVAARPAPPGEHGGGGTTAGPALIYGGLPGGLARDIGRTIGATDII